MRKRIFGLIAAFLLADLLVSPLPAGPASAEGGAENAAETPKLLESGKWEKNLRYDLYDDHAVITGGAKESGRIDIPAEIGDRPVTAIGDNAFKGNFNLTDATIPDGVTSIGPYAFFGCFSLTGLTLPDSVTSIGESAFFDCSGLKELSFPAGLREIGDQAFSFTALETLTLPDGLTEIGASAFSGCGALTRVMIPGSVKTVGEAAFFDCTALTDIRILAGVREIGKNAFAFTAPASVTLPEGLTEIGQFAFSQCAALTDVTLPKTLKAVGIGAFWEAPLKNVWYEGSGEQWKSLGLDRNNAELLNAQIHYGSVIVPDELPAQTETAVPDAQAEAAELEAGAGDAEPAGETENAVPEERIQFRNVRLPAGGKYVDSARLHYEEPDSPVLTVLLGSDGKLRMGEEAADFFSGEQILRLQNWSKITEIEACGFCGGCLTLVGLRRDGTIVREICGPDRENCDSCVPDGWRGVVHLAGNGVGDLVGLTKSGRVLIWNNGGTFSEEGGEYASWSGIRKIYPYSYPEGSILFGIRKDGSLAAEYGFYLDSPPEVPDGPVEEQRPDWAKKLIQISTSGYLTAFLDSAGSVHVSGMYASEYLRACLEELSGVRQIAATEKGVACRMADGTVRYFSRYAEESSLPGAVESWKDVTDLQAADHMLVALHRDGKVSVALGPEQGWAPEPYAEIRESAERWENITAVEVVRHNGPYILAWNRDGILLAAGLDLPSIAGQGWSFASVGA